MRVRLTLVLLLTGCDRRGAPPDGADDTDLAPLGIPEDNVVNALGDCEGHQRTPPAYPNQLSSGAELKKVTLTDPDAVCNDGTPAVMYVRAATDPALSAVWSLHLQGGGGCESWAGCVERWCGLGYYDASKMSSANLPDTIDGLGIYDANEVNVLAGANQAFFYYCSSDSWGGTSTVRYAPPTEGLPEGVTLPDPLPEFTMLARGHRIVEAGLEALERGVSGVGGVALPSLLDAERVVFSGTSAGSTGAARHADWLTARLAPNGTQVLAIFDAANSPAPEVYDEPYRAAVLDLDQRMWANRLAAADTPPFVDASCEAAHPGEDAFRCDEKGFVLANHITTPFLARQDLRDTTDSAEALDLPIGVWQAAVVDMLSGLTDAQATGLEGADLDVAPGAYGPNCAQHVALESTRWWVESTVRSAAGAEVSFQDAVLAWSNGAAMRVIDGPSDGAADGPRSTCATPDDGR